MTGKDSSVSSKELVNESDIATEEEIFTGLSIHPDWNVPQEEQYVLRFLNNDLDPLKPNQVSLAGIELSQEATGAVVTAFIRNSLSKGIQLGDTSLLLLDQDGKALARKQFDLAVVGEIPARSSRPWKFVFENEQLTTTELPKENWKLAFELKPKHRLDLEESWQKSLSDEDKARLEQIVKNVGEPKPGEVNFLGIQANMDEEQNLHITLLIRNGNNKNIQIEQMPLQVTDATGEVVAKGGFKLNNLEVKAYTSKPWTFIFPKEMLQKESLDLSKWKAEPVK